MQLNLFKPIAEEVDLSDKANRLLFLLNDGAKKRDFYEPKYYQQINDLIILCACNREKEHVFNIIDIDGNIPKDFSVNWRTIHHIKQDVKEHLEKQNLLIN